MKKPMTEETAALLAEAQRQTNEMQSCKDRITELGAERREVLAALRAAGITYKALGEALNLHHMTLQIDMRKYREQNAIETWESFTKNTAQQIVERDATDVS